MPQRNNTRKRRQPRRRRGLLSTGLHMPTLNSDAKTPMPIQVVPNRKYIIQFRNTFNLTCNGSAVLAGYIPFDPSATLSAAMGGGTLFNEWGSVANLFGAVRVVQAEIYLVRTLIDDSKGDSYGPVAMSSSITSVSTPGSYQAVIDNGDSQLWNCMQDYSGLTKYHSVKLRPAWASTSTPNPGSSNGMMVGCPGCIQFYGSTLAISSTIAWGKVAITYELKNRI